MRPEPPVPGLIAGDRHIIALTTASVGKAALANVSPIHYKGFWFESIGTNRETMKFRVASRYLSFYIEGLFSRKGGKNCRIAASGI
jgi:hypothetical protein